MARILTTGGYGFIGSAVAQSLVNAGHDVHVLDKFDVQVANAAYFRGSVLDQIAILEAMEGCDYVLHLAAVLGVGNSAANALECLDVNIIGTRNVLECAVKMRVKKVVFSSSSEVYGEPKVIPVPETAVLSPKSEYGVSKVVGEEYCRAYAQRFHLAYSIVRLFNVYGDKQRDDFVMSVFTTNAVNGQPLTLNGDGTQIRAFCYVDDVVDGMTKILFSDKTAGEVFNIGNPTEPISMRDLAKRILLHASRDESLIQQTRPEAADRTVERDIQQRVPEIRKAQDYVGFRPRVSLDDGIRRVLAFKKAQMRETSGR